MEYNFFYTNLLTIPAISFFLAIILKWFITWYNSGKIDLNRALWSWWMPSVHSALVTALATAVAIKHWVESDFFALSLSFTVIILYDAINVRFEAWLHASAINKLLWEKFKESLWHLPSEAFAWSLLGIFTAVVLYVL